MYINIVVPIAGSASRFKGWSAPKPLIMVGHRPMIEAAMECINDSQQCRYIFLVRKEHITSHAIDTVLRNKFPGCEIVVVDKLTEGTLCTCLLAKSLINNDDQLIIWTPDSLFEPPFDPVSLPIEADGMVLTFKANNPAHSYVKTDRGGYITEVAEKQVISEQANCGLYMWRKGSDFIKYSEVLVASNERVNGEFYIAPVYNLMINDGFKILTKEVKAFHALGTPEDLEFYTKNVMKKFGEQPVALCSDHSGFLLKEKAKKILAERGVEYIDFGCHSEKDVDYNDFVEPAVKHMKDGFVEFALGFCRSGNGLQICANKFSWVRAAYVFGNYTAEYAIRHNCANFFAIPSKFVSEELLEQIVDCLMIVKFDGGRHASRIQKCPI